MNIPTQASSSGQRSPSQGNHQIKYISTQGQEGERHANSSIQNVESGQDSVESTHSLYKGKQTQEDYDKAYVRQIEAVNALILYED